MIRGAEIVVASGGRLQLKLVVTLAAHVPLRTKTLNTHERLTQRACVDILLVVWEVEVAYMYIERGRLAL